MSGIRDHVSLATRNGKPVENFHYSDQNNPNTGGGGGGVEGRIAKLESDMEHVKTYLAEVKEDMRGMRSELKGDIKELRSEMRSDFRIIWAGMFAIALGLAGMMAKGFGWL